MIWPARWYNGWPPLTPEVAVQEIIQGPESAKLVYLSCYDRDGNRIGACLVRELRSEPIGFGSATVVEPCIDQEADKLCDEFLRRLRYTGLCEIELKRDVRNGHLKMIEANPRYSGTGDAAQYAGVDIGWLHYLDLIGVKVEPVRQNSRDFRHVVLFRDLTGLRSYRKAGLLSWRSLLHSYRPPVVFYDVHLRDWRVLTGYTLQFGKRVAMFVFRRLFRKRAARSPAVGGLDT